MKSSQLGYKYLKNSKRRSKKWQWEDVEPGYKCDCKSLGKTCEYDECLNSIDERACTKITCSNQTKNCNNRFKENNKIGGLYVTDVPGKGKGLFCNR